MFQNLIVIGFLVTDQEHEEVREGCAHVLCNLCCVVLVK